MKLAMEEAKSSSVSAAVKKYVRPVSSPHVVTPHVKPVEIRPLPTLSPNKRNRKRKIQKAEVLTSTPIKEQQKAKKERKKLTKDNNKKQTPKLSVVK